MQLENSTHTQFAIAHLTIFPPHYFIMLHILNLDSIASVQLLIFVTLKTSRAVDTHIYTSKHRLCFIQFE